MGLPPAEHRPMKASERGARIFSFILSPPFGASNQRIGFYDCMEQETFVNETLEMIRRFFALKMYSSDRDFNIEERC